MILLAVDPGLDRVAVAVYNTELCGSCRLEQAARGLLSVHQCSTSPTDRQAERIRKIAQFIDDQVRTHRAKYVVVELPAKGGAYHGRKSRQQTKGNLMATGEALLNRAIGAILGAAALAGVDVEGYSSAAYPREFYDKKQRHQVMNAALRRAGRPELKGNEDTRDAAFLGMFYLAQEHR